MKSYICEHEFFSEDLDHPGYSMLEYDLYAWIPKVSQEKHGLPNHRLKIWRNFITNEFELVMDIMENRISSFTYFNKHTQQQEFNLFKKNVHYGESIVVEKGSLDKIIKMANQMYFDLHTSVKQSDFYKDFLGEAYDSFVSPEEDEEISNKDFSSEKPSRLFKCQHEYPNKAYPCYADYYERLMKRFKSTLGFSLEDKEEQLKNQKLCESHLLRYYKTEDICSDKDYFKIKEIFFICEKCLTQISKKALIIIKSLLPEECLENESKPKEFMEKYQKYIINFEVK